jgi:hypothetical protein
MLSLQACIKLFATVPSIAPDIYSNLLQSMREWDAFVEFDSTGTLVFNAALKTFLYKLRALHHLQLDIYDRFSNLSKDQMNELFGTPIKCHPINQCSIYIQFFV